MSGNNISYPIIRPLGEDSVLVEFEAKVDLEINRKARRLVHGLEPVSYTHLTLPTTIELCWCLGGAGQ